MEEKEMDTLLEEPQETPTEEVTDADVVTMGDLSVTPEEKPEETEPPLPEEKPRLKYKSHEEAEKAYAEAEKVMHEATSKASNLEKELDRYKGVLKNLKEPPQQEKATVEEQIIDKAINDIKKIPQDDLEAERKANRIWARAQRDIADFRINERSNQERQVTQQLSIAEKKYTDAGLSLEVEVDGQKVDLGETAFWLVAKSPNMPRFDTLEEEADWCVQQVQLYNQAIIDAHEGKKKGIPQKPLGRGGKVVVPEQDTKPSTLIDDFNEVEKTRKIKE